jgi:hypothetical protein
LIRAQEDIEMQAQDNQASGTWVLRSLVAALAAATACNAWADDEPSPYYIGASETITHDSNVSNTANGTGDTYSTTGLVGGFDQAIGRQRLYANAKVSYSRYRSETQFNNTSYGVAAGWNWATINNLSGSLAVNANQGLASLANTSGPLPTTTGDKNLVKTDQVSTSVLWGGVGDLGIQGSYAHSRVKYTAAESATSQSSADTGSIGTFYKLGPTVKVGVDLRYSRTYTPYAQPTVQPPQSLDDYESNTATGRNLDLTVDWRVTPETGLDTRLSWTRQTNSTTKSLDFSGLTGAVTARYAPTAKTSFNATFSRDAGTNASFFNVIPSTNTGGTGTTTGTTGGTTNGTPSLPETVLSQTSQTSTTYSLGANYAATAKIGMTLDGSYRRAKLLDANGAETDENTRIATFGINWAAGRNWHLGCNLSRSSRSATGANGTSYSANSTGCTAQVTLR